MAFEYTRLTQNALQWPKTKLSHNRNIGCRLYRYGNQPVSVNATVSPIKLPRSAFSCDQCTEREGYKWSGTQRQSPTAVKFGFPGSPATCVKLGLVILDESILGTCDALSFHGTGSAGIRSLGRYTRVQGAGLKSEGKDSAVRTGRKSDGQATGRYRKVQEGTGRCREGGEGRYREVKGGAGRCREVQCREVQCSEVQGGAGRCRELQGGTVQGGTVQGGTVQGGTGRYREVQGGTGRCREVQRGAGRYSAGRYIV
eukprot:1186499-Prorocentrum_minimum.AAC.1